MAAEDGKKISHHLKQLINREKIRNHYCRIKQCEGRFRTGGVDKVMAETDAGLQLVFEKLEIETAIKDANKKKLQQANNTPFRTEPLQSLLGEQMDYENGKRY